MSTVQIFVAVAVFQWSAHGAAAGFFSSGVSTSQNHAPARSNSIRTPLKLPRKLLTRIYDADLEYHEERLSEASEEDEIDTTLDSYAGSNDDISEVPAPAPAPDDEDESGVMGVSDEPTESAPPEPSGSSSGGMDKSGELGVSDEPTESARPEPSGSSSGGMDKSGELTYYGGAGEGGACTSTHVPEGFGTVAMNNEEYADGAMCGTCVRACFTNEETGEGERCIDAIVDNKCPECKKGDLDLGESGSGRWPVQWKVIPCPKTSELMVSAQGSNSHYAKLKVEGGPSGVASMSCAGQSGSMTDDAYFIFNDGSGKMGCGMDCEVRFSEGGSASVHVEGNLLGGGC